MKFFAKSLSVAALFAFTAFAGEWKGTISDSHCGAKHADGAGEKCVQGCIKKGASAVLVTDGKVLKIANGDAVKDHLGHKVTVTGELDGDTITVESVKM